LTIWVNNRRSCSYIDTTPPALHTNAWYHAKIDVVGSSAYGKAWAFVTAEPAWQVTASQAAIMTAGVGGLRTGAADVYYANYIESPIPGFREVTRVAGRPDRVTVTLSSGATTVLDAGAYVFIRLAARYP
jgi:hypothetical protein